MEGPSTNGEEDPAVTMTCEPHSVFSDIHSTHVTNKEATHANELTRLLRPFDRLLAVVPPGSDKRTREPNLPNEIIGLIQRVSYYVALSPNSRLLPPIRHCRCPLYLPPRVQ